MILTVLTSVSKLGSFFINSFIAEFFFPLPDPFTDPILFHLFLRPIPSIYTSKDCIWICFFTMKPMTKRDFSVCAIIIINSGSDFRSIFFLSLTDIPCDAYHLCIPGQEYKPEFINNLLTHAHGLFRHPRDKSGFFRAFSEDAFF